MRRNKKPTDQEIRLEVDRLEAALTEATRQLWLERPTTPFERRMTSQRLARQLVERVTGR